MLVKCRMSANMATSSVGTMAIEQANSTRLIPPWQTVQHNYVPVIVELSPAARMPTAQM